MINNSHLFKALQRNRPEPCQVRNVAGLDCRQLAHVLAVLLHATCEARFNFLRTLGGVLPNHPVKRVLLAWLIPDGCQRSPELSRGVKEILLVLRWLRAVQWDVALLRHLPCRQAP